MCRLNCSASYCRPAGRTMASLAFADLRQRGVRAPKMWVRMLSATLRVWQRAWRALTRSVRGHYRPEKHYMRGPGPKYRAKGIERNAGKRGSTLTSANDNAKATTSANDESKGG